MPITIGQTIGQYVIRGKIGEGGMGAVYRADQPAVNRVVVLKVLSANFAEQPDALDRFRRELDIIAQLEHPHILPVYDFGQVDGSPYIVMRYMSGGSLYERFRDSNLLREKLLNILTQTASALDYSHARGIIHRDLKPANILLDAQGNAYLADFGLAKTLEGSRDLTSTGSILGTPAYMSPEQARGDKLTPASDIYSFAIVAYEGLCGRQPFRAATAWEYVDKHLSEPPPPITAFDPKLPTTIDPVLQSALAKEPPLRPARASEFTAQLSAALFNQLPSTVASVQRSANAATRAAVGLPTVSPPNTATGQVRSAAQPGRGGFNWLILGAIGALLVGGLIAVVALAGSLLAIQSNPLAPKPAVYAVGDSPRALLYDGTAVWVANFFDNSVAKLIASNCEASPDPCGQALGTYGVDDLPTALAYDGTSIWVASALNQTLVQLDPQTGQSLSTHRLPNVPSALLFAGNVLWSANAFANSVTRINTQNFTTTDIAAGQSPVALAFDGAFIWTANQQDLTLTKIDAASGSVAGAVALFGSPSAVAFDGTWLWVAITNSNEVLQIDPGSGQISGRVSVGKRPVALFYQSGSLWVANQDDDSISRIDVAGGTVINTYSVSGGPFALTVVPCGDGCVDVWVASEGNDTVSRLRLK